MRRNEIVGAIAKGLAISFIAESVITNIILLAKLGFGKHKVEAEMDESGTIVIRRIK